MDSELQRAEISEYIKQEAFEYACYRIFEKGHAFFRVITEEAEERGVDTIWLCEKVKLYAELASVESWENDDGLVRS